MFIAIINYITVADLPPSKEMFSTRSELIKFGVQNGFIKPKHLEITIPF